MERYSPHENGTKIKLLFIEKYFRLNTGRALVIVLFCDVCVSPLVISIGRNPTQIDQACVFVRRIYPSKGPSNNIDVHQNLNTVRKKG
jgi:hypothetical protein